MSTKRVILNTVTTQISKEGRIKPKSPIWAFVNTGGNNLIINNTYILFPGDTFGLSADAIVGHFLKEGIIVESATEFDVRWTGADVTRSTGHLLETFIELKEK